MTWSEPRVYPSCTRTTGVISVHPVSRMGQTNNEHCPPQATGDACLAAVTPWTLWHHPDRREASGCRPSVMRPPAFRIPPTNRCDSCPLPEGRTPPRGAVPWWPRPPQPKLVAEGPLSFGDGTHSIRPEPHPCSGCLLRPRTASTPPSRCWSVSAVQVVHSGCPSCPDGGRLPFPQPPVETGGCRR